MTRPTLGQYLIEEFHTIGIDQFLYCLDVIKAIADLAVEFRLRRTDLLEPLTDLR